MKINTLKRLVFLWSACLLTMSSYAQGGEAVWHCSRASAVQASLDDAGEGFGVSMMPSANGMIAVTLEDLYAAYTGYPIRVSGKPLFACFMPGREDLSIRAFDGLGVSSAALQMLSRRSAIVQRNLKLVTDEEEMLSCMEGHIPSFGYLSRPISNEKVAPCF
jgi:hypothetical protein